MGICVVPFILSTNELNFLWIPATNPVKVGGGKGTELFLQSLVLR